MRLGVDQPTVSGLLRGRRRFSADRLIHFLNLLGCDVHIRIARARTTVRGAVRFENGR